MTPMSATHADAPARLYLLGPFRLEVGGQPVALPTRKAEALLAYLALHEAPAGHSRERLAALFWGDSPDADARRSLRVALTGLRKALGGDPFSGDRATIGLDPTFPLWTDAVTLDDLARRYLAGGADELAEACAALYRGDLLADFYEDWLSLPRDRLRGRYQQVLRALAERRRERGDYGAAAEAANRLLALDPADEAAHQQLMFCYLAQGDRPAALQQYEACARALRDELAVPPSAETEALLSWIRDAAPARSPAARRGNVPLPLSDLIGRADALAEIERLLAPLGRTRLLTLTGPGGNGKTRLAQATGHALADRYRDGAWWVDLVPLTDGAQITAAVTRALGLPETPGQPAVESLIRHLADRQALLILDNCEHMIAAAAALVAHLLSHCREIQVLATSREVLGVPGEQTYRVAPLPAPLRDRELSPDTLAKNPAIALFIERAASHLPGFRLTAENGPAIAHICRRLDGIPLAIELAAARVSALTVGQIAERLNDRFRLLRGGARTARPQQRTLQALFDWSYDLLTPDEQALFRRLAVFAGGWTLDAAEAVWDKEASDHAVGDRKGRPYEVVDLLARLADKSLIVVSETPDGARYGFLETILAYARQQLADPVEAAAAAEAHLAHFLALVERAEPELRGPGMFAWLARLAREHDNLQTALEWALGPQADASRRLAGLRLAAALQTYWHTRGHARGGRRWLETALLTAPGDTPTSLLAKAHAAAGTMAWLLGDFAAAVAHHQAALAGYRSIGDGRGAAWALGNLAVCANEGGEHLAALARYAEATELARTAGATWEQALILNNQSAALIDQGCADEAIPLLETSASLLRSIGDEWAASHPTLNLAEIAVQRGEYERAGQLLDNMAALAERLGIKHLLAAVHLRRGSLYLGRGQPAAAANAYRASLRSNLESADRVETIRALEGLALALIDLAIGDRAARLLAAADAQRAALGAARQPTEATAIERGHARLRARFAASILAAASEAGRRLSLEDAAAAALL